MAADGTHEFLTPPDSDGASLPAQTRDFDDAEWDLGALEREVAAAEALRLANGHRKICGDLHLRYGDVSADDLARASLSDEPDIQCVRLAPLFKMCGLIGVGYEIERADLVKTIADAGPQSEAEMRLLFQITSAEFMAARCAADAMQPRQDVAVMSLQMANFGKLTRIGFDLRVGLEKLRSAQRPSLRLLETHSPPDTGGDRDWAARPQRRAHDGEREVRGAHASGRRVPLAGCI